MPAKREDFTPLTFDDIFDDDYDKEHQGKYRKVEIENNIVHIRSEDPYGFWKISLQKGQLPEKLKGAYTSFDQALRDVNLWLKDKKEFYIPSETATKKVN